MPQLTWLGDDIRPMFPDLVVVREVGDELAIGVLEPHDLSLGENFEKAVGLARFGERHGGHFGRIELIREQSTAGGKRFIRLNVNRTEVINRLLATTSNPQLDDVFKDFGA